MPPMKSDPGLKRLYDRYNTTWFGGKLPEDTVVQFKRTFSTDAGKRKANMGLTQTGKPSVISIDPTLKRLNLETTIKFTLLHECAHIATITERALHGDSWQAEMRRLAAAGAFDKLW